MDGLCKHFDVDTCRKWKFSVFGGCILKAGKVSRGRRLKFNYVTEVNAFIVNSSNL